MTVGDGVLALWCQSLCGRVMTSGRSVGWGAGGGGEIQEGAVAAGCRNRGSATGGSPNKGSEAGSGRAKAAEPRRAAPRGERRRALIVEGGGGESWWYDGRLHLGANGCGPQVSKQASSRPRPSVILLEALAACCCFRDSLRPRQNCAAATACARCPALRRRGRRRVLLPTTRTRAEVSPGEWAAVGGL